MHKIITDVNNKVHTFGGILFIMIVIAFCASIGNSSRLNTLLEEQYEINEYLTCRVELIEEAIEILADRTETNTDGIQAIKDYSHNWVTIERLSLTVKEVVEKYKEE